MPLGAWSRDEVTRVSLEYSQSFLPGVNALAVLHSSMPLFLSFAKYWHTLFSADLKQQSTGERRLTRWMRQNHQNQFTATEPRKTARA